MRPKEICDQLDISAPTLRLWSNHFEDSLSPSARASLTERGTPAQRRYTEDDLAVFRRAKTLLDLGLKYEDVKEKLLQPETSASLQLVPFPTSPNGHSHEVATTEPSIDLSEIRELLARSVALQEQQVALLQQLDLATETRRLIALQEEQLAILREERDQRLTQPEPSTLWQRLVAAVKT